MATNRASAAAPARVNSQSKTNSGGIQLSAPVIFALGIVGICVIGAAIASAVLLLALRRRHSNTGPAAGVLLPNQTRYGPPVPYGQPPHQVWQTQFVPPPGPRPPDQVRPSQ